MRLIDIIEYISNYDTIKIYIDGDYFETYENKDKITYECLKLSLSNIYCVCNGIQSFLTIDLKR